MYKVAKQFDFSIQSYWIRIIITMHELKLQDKYIATVNARSKFNVSRYESLKIKTIERCVRIFNKRSLHNAMISKPLYQSAYLWTYSLIENRVKYDV